MSKIAFVFPGQGSQQVGMGVSIAEVSPGAKNLFEQADEISGKGLFCLCANGPQELLVQTVNAQPAVFTVDCAAMAALAEKGVRPEAAAGHSLGEYAALVAAEVLDFAAALRLVVKRAELMQECCAKYPGKMLAVLGLDFEKVDEIVRSRRKAGVLQAANYNSPGQVVVSGNAAAVEQSAPIFEENGGKTMELVVSGAFHSALMSEAAEEFARILEGVDFRDARIPVVPNFTGRASTDAGVIKKALKSQILGSVRWQQSMDEMAALGVTTIVEVGPGRVLRGLARKCIPGATLLNVEDAKSLEATLRALA